MQGKRVKFWPGGASRTRTVRVQQESAQQRHCLTGGLLQANCDWVANAESGHIPSVQPLAESAVEPTRTNEDSQNLGHASLQACHSGPSGVAAIIYCRYNHDKTAASKVFAARRRLSRL